MKYIRYPRIQVRLFIGMLIIVLSSSVISVSYLRDIKRLQKVTNDIIEHPFAMCNSVRNIDISINAMHRSLVDVVLSENEEDLDRALSVMNDNETFIYGNFEIVKEQFLGELELVDEVYTSFNDWKPVRNEIVELVLKGDVENATRLIKEKENDHLALLLDKNRKMMDVMTQKAARFNQNSIITSEKSKSGFMLFLMAISVLGIVLSLGFFYRFNNSISLTIERIKMVLGKDMKGFSFTSGDGLTVLDHAISEYENSKLKLEQELDSRTNELREVQNLIENTIGNAPIGIVEVGLDGKFISANQSFCNTIGYSLSELQELNFNDITHDEDRDIGREYLTSALEGGDPKIKIEKRYLHKTGKIVYAAVSSLLVFDAQGEPLHFFSHINDISKQKEYELELNTHRNELDSLISERTSELNDKAIRLERSQQALTFLLEDVNDIKKQLKISNNKLVDANKEMEAFSYSVSHDLKAPLRAVIGFSQILQEDYASQLDTESGRYINLIKDNAENMGALINDLLSFSRMGRTVLQKTKVDLALLGQRVKNELMLDLQNRELSINFTALPVVRADEKLMYHVMLNLMSNAVKFTSKVEKAIVEIGCTFENNECVFFVKDNGVGFDMKYAGRIFDVFQRLHTVDEFPGTGIGLSIVQRIIHKHEGRVWVESEINKGTTFFFTL